MLQPNSILSCLPKLTEHIYIAYSGGVDSHVLLHLACCVVDIKEKITAVYVHHGIQHEAEAWAIHCEKIASDLGVSFKCLRVDGQKVKGASPEEVARDARYLALKALLKKNDTLLLAQHREDQLETVLLQLFRGAGLQGLSGMPLSIKFGSGTMSRPFLDVSKTEIQQYAQHQRLNWVEDSSNQSNDYDRNFLRNQVLPLLKQRWPGLDKTVSRSAYHCAESQTIIQTLSQQWLNNILDESDQTINIKGLQKLDNNQQSLVLRAWFNYLHLKMPSKNRVEKILNEVVLARQAANPVVQVKEFCIRRYREKLYCLKTSPKLVKVTEISWSKQCDQFKLDDNKVLNILTVSEGISKQLWDNSEVTVKFRSGTEKIRLPGRNCHHTLKKLFQEKGIPPWERNHIPLIYLDNKLAAISDLWISADFLTINKEQCIKITLQHPLNSA